MASSSSIRKLAPGLTNYAWGKKGSNSLCAQLASVSIPDFQIEEDEPYAELWMGTHPKLPARLPSGQPLSEHLVSHPEAIGDTVASVFPQSKDGALPFLFKVLSIGKALSIQAHPDKKLGAQLHARSPDVYTDGSHKPEMAIALTPFKAFLNFLPLATILSYVLTVPELSSLIPAHIIQSFQQSVESSAQATNFDLPPTEEQRTVLRRVFERLMCASKDDVKDALDNLVQRYTTGSVQTSEKHLVDLTLMLHRQFPGDVGALCVFMLNVVDLKEGEAAYLQANEPHAYISGDIIECMATSDNVVRAGLTPMYRDVETLISMLTYNAGPGEKQLLKALAFGDDDDNTTLYDPPIEEFSVLKLDLAPGQTARHRALSGPSVCIVVKGQGLVDAVEITKGEVLFIPADVVVEWKAVTGLKVCRAFCEIN